MQEDDEEDVDLRTSAAGTEAIIVGGQPGLGGLGHGGGHRGQPGQLQPKQTTYLVDHHPQLFEPPSLTNYATMPRQPPGVNILCLNPN